MLNFQRTFKICYKYSKFNFSLMMQSETKKSEWVESKQNKNQFSHIYANFVYFFD